MDIKIKISNFQNNLHKKSTYYRTGSTPNPDLYPDNQSQNQQNLLQQSCRKAYNSIVQIDVYEPPSKKAIGSNKLNYIIIKDNQEIQVVSPIPMKKSQLNKIELSKSDKTFGKLAYQVLSQEGYEYEKVKEEKDAQYEKQVKDQQIEKESYEEEVKEDQYEKEEEEEAEGEEKYDDVKEEEEIEEDINKVEKQSTDKATKKDDSSQGWLKQKFKEKLKKTYEELHWNGFLRQLCMFGLVSTIYALLFLKSISQDEMTFFSRVSQVCSYIMILLLSFCFPLWILWFLKQNRDNCHTKEFKAKFGTLCNEFKTDTLMHQGWLGVMQLRKTFCAMAVIIPDDPSTECYLLLLVNGIYTLIFMVIRPYKSKRNQTVFTITEIAVIITHVGTLMLINNMTDKDQIVFYGWVILAGFIMIIAPNICFMIIYKIEAIIKWSKEREKKKEAEKKKEEEAEKKSKKMKEDKIDKKSSDEYEEFDSDEEWPEDLPQTVGTSQKSSKQLDNFEDFGSNEEWPEDLRQKVEKKYQQKSIEESRKSQVDILEHSTFLQIAIQNNLARRRPQN